MKLTPSDVAEVLKQSQQIGGDPNAESTQVTSALLSMLQKLPDYDSLVRELPMHTLIEAIKKGQTDQSQLLHTTAQMGVLCGISIGFQLGLREAGLELGIGSSAGSSKE